jgi:hypothetical protein
LRSFLQASLRSSEHAVLERQPFCVLDAGTFFTNFFVAFLAISTSVLVDFIRKQKRVPIAYHAIALSK